MKFVLAITLALSMLFVSPRTHSPVNRKDLSITPRLQETAEWCWLTVGEMVFEHYNIPAVNATSYQCGIVAAFDGPHSSCWHNCGTCPYPAGSFENIQRMLSVYPQGVAALTGRPTPSITSKRRKTPLSKSALKNELDNDRPVIVGISPSGFPRMQSEHVALIVGYDEDDGGLTLTVNDPFPYDLPQFAGLGNPYARAKATDNRNGSYSVGYDLFKDAVLWKESIYEIQSSTNSGGRDGSSGDDSDAFRRCMAERPAACIRECMDHYRHSYAACHDQFCRPNDPVNINNWGDLCRRRLDRHN